MEIIFRTIDGKDFTSEMEARKHENTLLDGIVMLGRNGEIVQRTEDAFILWLKNEDANSAFFAMAKQQGDNNIHGLVEGEDYGLFYWDEWEDTYRWIGKETIVALTKAQSIIQAKGGLAF